MRHIVGRRRLALAGLLAAACASAPPAPMPTGADSTWFDAAITAPGSDCSAEPLRLVDGAAPARLGPLVLEAGWRLSGDADFGGLSGLDTADATGANLIAVTDQGRIIEIALSETGPACRAGALAGPDGRALTDKSKADAEGVAVDPSDPAGTRIWVSFERAHRIAAFGGGALGPTDGPDLGDSSSLGENRGLEALEILPSGAMIAGAESISPFAAPHPVWRFAPDGAGGFTAAPGPTLTVQGAPGYGLVGFAASADTLYVLQRFYTRQLGNRMRLSRLALTEVEALAAGDHLDTEHLATLDTAGPIPVDNFEGIAAWHGQDGRTRLAVVSDNNFSGAQQTLLYIFVLME